MKVNLILFSLLLNTGHYFIMGWLVVFLQSPSLGTITFVPPQINMMDRKKVYEIIPSL